MVGTVLDIMYVYGLAYLTYEETCEVCKPKNLKYRMIREWGLSFLYIFFRIRVLATPLPMFNVAKFFEFREFLSVELKLSLLL